MKILRLLSLSLLVFALPANAQTEAPEVPENLEPWQEEFFNLPEDRRREFSNHVQKARELFGQKRVFESIEELHAARKIFADSPDVENLLGACQVEFRAFDKALEHFDRANNLAPGNPSVLFNFAEVYFVTKKWTEAARYFRRVLELTADNEDQNALRFLTEFKIMLCMIKTDQMDEAKKMAEQYDFMDDTPFPHYAEAALAYEQGDEVAAEAALARASRIFQNPQILSPWHDTLMEFGYIKSFYGGDLAEE